MAIISQGLELMKPDYFHYLPLRWRQSERADMLVGVRAPGPGGAEEPPCGGGGSLPLRSPHAWSGESQRCCLKITGDKTIVPRREAERKPQVRQGQKHRRDIWACLKHGIMVDQERGGRGRATGKGAPGSASLQL